MRRYTIGAFVALLAAASLLAQSSVGIVRGTVKDQSGGVLPGATVRLSHAPDSDRTTITDAKGRVFVRRPSARTVRHHRHIERFHRGHTTGRRSSGAVVRLSLELRGRGDGITGRRGRVADYQYQLDTRSSEAVRGRRR
jgi:hypothetical protein